MFLGWYVFNKWNEGVYKNGEDIYCYKQVKSNKSVINNLVGYGIIVIGYKDAWFEINIYCGYLSFFIRFFISVTFGVLLNTKPLLL